MTGILCPKCGHPRSSVVDTRPKFGRALLQRRRECLACQSRFNTEERIGGRRPTPYRSRRRPAQDKLPPVGELRFYRQRGLTLKELGGKYGVAQNTVRNKLKGNGHE